MNRKHTNSLLLTTAISLALTACGGGGGGGGSAPPPSGGGAPPPAPATPTPITVVGPVTGFGSVYVAGIRFDTTSASYDVDDAAAFDDRALSVGMVVKVEGLLDDDGLSGEAERISYDDEVEGRVENLAIDPTDDALKNFTIFGVQTVADADTTVFRSEHDAGFGWESLSSGDNVEISGFYDGDVLMATYIEKEDGDDDDVEVKGTVDGFDGAAFDLILADGSRLSVTLAEGALIPPTGVQDGMFAEVEGMSPGPSGDPRTLLAYEVESEDEDMLDDDDAEVEMEGILTFDSDRDAWTLLGTPLTFDDSSRYQPAGLREALADGSAEGRRVKVHGDHRDGSLRVDEIETEDADDGVDDDIEIRGLVQAIDPTDAAKVGTLTIAFPPLADTVDVEVNERTMFADDDAAQPFDLRDLSAGRSFVKVKVSRDANGALIASRLEREDGSRYEIEATVDAMEDGVSITLLGITFGIDAGTEFDDPRPAAGDFAEVRDNDTDGIADEVELDN